MNVPGGRLAARRGGAPAVGAGLVLSLVLAAACAVGPKYQLPAPPPLPPEFKELGPWKDAQPSDAMPRGRWWETYGDPQLNSLQEQLSAATHQQAANPRQPARGLNRLIEGDRLRASRLRPYGCHQSPKGKRHRSKAPNTVTHRRLL